MHSLYGTEELQKVLEPWADIAIHCGTLEEGVIPLCAAQGRQDGANARCTITHAPEARDLARTENADWVTTDHVERAREKSDAQRSMDIMHDLIEHDHLTLYALTTLVAEDTVPVLSRIVYQRHKEFCEFQDRDPRTDLRMRSFLSDIEIPNLTISHMEHRGQRRNYREHELNRDIATVVDALQTIISEESLNH